MAFHHPHGTTGRQRPPTRPPLARHPRSTLHAPPPPRTARDAPADPPAGDPANAPPADLSDSLPTPSVCPSQPPRDRVLRRPLEFAQYTAVVFGERCARAGITP